LFHDISSLGINGLNIAPECTKDEVCWLYHVAYLMMIFIWHYICVATNEALSLQA